MDSCGQRLSDFRSFPDFPDRLGFLNRCGRAFRKGCSETIDRSIFGKSSAPHDLCRATPRDSRQLGRIRQGFCYEPPPDVFSVL